MAALLGLPLLLGAAAGIVGAALAVGLAARAPGVGRDTAVAVVVTGLFGLGALLALSASSPPGLQGLLFGDVLGVTGGDLLLAGALAAVIVVALRLLHGRLVAVGFDRSTARQLGVSPAVIDAAVLVLLALTILVAVQGLGNLLVVAVLVAPAATARPLTSRIGSMAAVAVAVALAAGIGGLYLSYYAGTAAGASIAALLVAAFLAAQSWRRAGLAFSS
jgi:ABC-type Mn2+/Zn2+ transport system permease subunit